MCVCLNFWHKKLREIYLICHNIINRCCHCFDEILLPKGGRWGKFFCQSDRSQNENVQIFEKWLKRDVIYQKGNKEDFSDFGIDNQYW